ncbi:hypothetical protein [Streptomyces sp. CBMA152]|uniref:hypothetical protein n=1 Tax=Streptomyces sp. CBMA152 TaxID=1896312 RepID=UPI00166165C8|nr:hypothetical protein [Streptomyces sp. CBMA152]MBD0746650.1 hypothetical protein [Streptomyces sp. CBMA152]
MSKNTTALARTNPRSAGRQRRPGGPLDLAALVLLLAVAAALFLTVGPAGLSLVVSTGAGLYTTWRTHR